jgi:glucose/mannose-6-phosphate isomerase
VTGVSGRFNDVNMDHPSSLRASDPSGMLDVLSDFPDQLLQAVSIGRSKIELPDPEGLRGIAVVGMGGSGISGDVVSAVAAAAGLSLPVFTVKGYELPPYVGSDFLVFAVSYSGNTEETLDCFEQAAGRGARLVALSSGGQLAEEASRLGVPHLRVPSGIQPRAAFGYLFAPQLAVLERMGLIEGICRAVEEAASVLEERSMEYSVDTPLDENPTKRVAKDLVGYVPVVYGSEGALEVTASRWKAQFNEMAKVPSFCNRFPELNHNETVGWSNLEDVCKRFHLLVLRQPGEHPRVSRRIRVTVELLHESVGHISQVCARGDNYLERLLDLIYFGDYTSVYLALALGQDPTPVKRIDELKRLLAEPDRR